MFSGATGYIVFYCMIIFICVTVLSVSVGSIYFRACVVGGIIRNCLYCSSWGVCF